MTLEDIKNTMNDTGIVNIIELRSDYDNWVSFEVATETEANYIYDTIEEKSGGIFNWCSEPHRLSDGNYMLKAEVIKC